LLVTLNLLVKWLPKSISCRDGGMDAARRAAV